MVFLFSKASEDQKASSDKPSKPYTRKSYQDRPAGKCPSEARLRDIALHHLSKFSSTQANLVQVLKRRVQRWALRAKKEGQDADHVEEQKMLACQAVLKIAQSMVDVGAINDDSFAKSRVRSLSRSGRSKRAISAHLAQKGVEGALAEEILEASGDTDLAAALVHLRKKRQGPFARQEEDMAKRQKVMAGLARSGFSHDTAKKAIKMLQEEAEDYIFSAREEAF